MKISIITVSFNSKNTIANTISSVFSQDYDNIEYIIIDGASKDGTVNIIEEFSNIYNFKYISEPDNGIYDAMNKGLSFATGDIVGFLNSDDFFSNERIISTVAKIMQNHFVDACYGDLIYVDKVHAKKIIRFWKSKSYSPGLCLSGWMPAHPTFYLRKSIYDTFGYYDTNYKLQSDFEMMIRLFEIKKITSVYIPIVMVCMRIGGASNARLSNIIKGNIEAIESCRKHGFKAGYLFVIKKFLSRIPQFFLRP